MGFGLGRRQDRGGGCAARMIRCLAVEAGAGNPAEPGRFGRAGIFAVLRRARRRVGFPSNSGCSSRRRAPQLSHTNRRRCHISVICRPAVTRSRMFGAGVMHSAALVPARGAPGHRPPRPDLGFQAGGGVLQHCYHPHPRNPNGIVVSSQPIGALLVIGLFLTSPITVGPRPQTKDPTPATPPFSPRFREASVFRVLAPVGGGGRGLTGGFTGKGSGLRGGRRRRRLLSAGGRGQEGVRTGGLRRFVGRGIRPPPVLIGQNVQQLPAPGRFPAAKEGASSPYILIRRGCTIGASWR